MNRLLLIFVVLLIVLLGCGGGEVETETAVSVEPSTSVAPEPTALPPTEEPEPTPVPPTEEPDPTPIPPTEAAPPPTEEPEAVNLAELEQALQALVDAQVEAGFPSTMLWVEAPDINFSWNGVAGMADVDAEIPFTPNTPFRLASTSKMMTAAVMLRLDEEGRLDLDDPISQYLDTTITDLLKSPDDEPYGEMITIRQLLNHTSGVADHFSPTQPGYGLKNFEDIFVSDPQKVWEPIEAIAFSTDNHDPQFAPGEGWGYSNTNFILAGLIIEEISGMSLAEAYQEYLFDPLGMMDTFFAQTGDPRLEEVSHPYFNDLDVSGYPSLSWLWGTGGIVTTAEDLNRFMWALVDDEIFSDPASNEAMMDWTSMASVGFDGLSYGLGIIQIDFAEFGMPEIGIIQGHNSLWNGFVYYWPQYNIVFGGVLNQVVPDSVYTELANPAMFTILPYVTAE